MQVQKIQNNYYNQNFRGFHADRNALKELAVQEIYSATAQSKNAQRSMKFYSNVKKLILQNLTTNL